MKKFALILGASGAIGSAICKRLAEDGWSLYMHYNHNETKVMRLREELSSQYTEQEFLVVQADFSSDVGAETLVNQIYSLQAIVFANGHAFYGLIEDTSVEEMENLWKVHVQNPMRLLALISNKLRSNDVSYVLFIGSIWGEAGAAYETVYATVKGAQHAFVKAYSKEVALQHILVNAISPGFIETSMNYHLSDEDKQQILDEIPLQRAGKTEDIANLVAFYISGQADYVTGQIIRVNGGWYI